MSCYVRTWVLVAFLSSTATQSGSAHDVAPNGKAAPARHEVCPSVLLGERAERIAERVAGKLERERVNWNSATALTYVRSQLAAGLRSEPSSGGSAVSAADLKDLSRGAVAFCLPRLGAVIATLVQGSDTERLAVEQQQRREEEEAQRQVDAAAAHRRIEAERLRQVALMQQREAESERQRADRRDRAEVTRAERETAAKASDEAARVERERFAEPQQQRADGSRAKREQVETGNRAEVGVAPSRPEDPYEAVRRRSREAREAEAMERARLDALGSSGADVMRRSREIQAEQQRAYETAQAEAAKPENIMLTAYRHYLVVRQCFEARSGYAAVYLTPQQMEEAKAQVKGIEAGVLKRAPNLNTDEHWAAANRAETAANGDISELGFTGRGAVKERTYTEQGRQFCSAATGWLKGAYGLFYPDSLTVKKDF